eukprot:1633544-Prymnesium_polylepis.1
MSCAVRQRRTAVGTRGSQPLLSARRAGIRRSRARARRLRGCYPSQDGLVARGVLLHPRDWQRTELQRVVPARHPAAVAVPRRLHVRAVVAHHLEHQDERLVKVVEHTDAREVGLAGVALAIHDPDSGS